MNYQAFTSSTRLLRRFLIITAALIFASTVWLGWTIYSSYTAIKKIDTRNSKSQKLRGQIVHFDEVLTMSARMAAATGNPRWERRYRQFEPQLDKAIKEAISIAPCEYTGDFAVKTDKANIALVAMENRAFELVRKGLLEEAKSVLFSNEYERQKEVYAQGMKSYEKRLDILIKEDLQSAKNKMFLGVAVIFLIVFLLSVSWFVVERIKERQELLQHLKDTLENRVHERTQELRNEITERKLAEEALRESEVQFRVLAQSATDAIIFIDHEGKIIFCNKSAQNMYGYEEDEMLGKPVAIIVPERIRENDRNSFSDLISEGKSAYIGRVFESVGLRKDGTEFPIEPTYSIVTAGKKISYCGIIRDISERKLALERLQKSEQFLKDSQHIAHMGSWERDFISGKTFWSDEFFVLLGYAPGEVEPSFELFHNHIHPEDQKIIPKYPAETYSPFSTIEHEYRLINKNGSTLQISSRTSFDLDDTGNVIRVHGFLQDITEKEKIRNELQAANDFLESVFAYSKDGIIVTDTQGNIRKTNDAIEKLLKYKKEEIEGENIVILAAGDKKIIRQAAESLKVLSEKGLVTHEIQFVAKDGERIDVEVSSSRLRDKVGNYVGALSIVRDIRERKLTEAQIMTSLKEKEILLKEIHHRVKNNLAIISSLLSLQAEKTEDPKVLEAFNASQDRIRSMALIHNILYESDTLSKLDFHEYILKLGEALFTIYLEVPRAIKLKINLDNMFLEIDRAIPCGLIINELMTNSLKYAFPGGKKGAVSIGFMLEDDKQYKLIFSDDGVGLPENIDIKNTETLGLKLVHILVEQLSGTVDLDRNGGTTFTIKFAK